MASPTVNVVRWSALIGGIFYGIVHQGTLQAKYDEDQSAHRTSHRASLVDKAREAYAEKLKSDKSGSKLITDPEDPKFDLEKLVESWTSSS